MFHRKKPSDNLSASTVALMTGFGLLLGVLIGVSVVPQGLQKSSAPAPEPTLRTSMVSYAPQFSCSCDYDAAIGTGMPNNSSITYDIPSRAFLIKVYLENRGNRSVSNIAWRVINNTTGQLFASGTYNTIPAHTGYNIFNNTIRVAQDGSPLTLWQGDHSVKFEITNYDQKNTEDTNRSANNVFTQNVRVPVIDLEPNSYIPRPSGNKLYHQLGVGNIGDNSASSGTFRSKIEVNGVQDAIINFPSITGGGGTMPGFVLGTANLSKGYNFVRAIVDDQRTVTERNESRNQAETNNVYNMYVYEDNSDIVTRGQYNSPTWFMKTPTIPVNSNYISVPIINISANTQTIAPTFNVYTDGDCRGTQIKTVTLTQNGGNYTITPNATTYLSIGNLTTTELQGLNNRTVCVKFVNGDGIARNFYAGFPDLTITNYQASLVTISPAKYVYNGNALNNSTSGIVHRITVKNNGNAPAQNLKVDVFSNGTYDNRGGASYNIPFLNMGAETTITIQPEKNALIGFNIVKVKVDGQAAIAEINENNNAAYSEVKIENNQIVTGFPRIYPYVLEDPNQVEGKNYYMYRPRDNIANGRTTYVTPITVIGDTALSPNVKFENYYTQGGQIPTTVTFNQQNNWQPGQFKEFNLGPYPSSDCYIKLKLLVNYGGAETFESRFTKSDISQNNTCI